MSSDLRSIKITALTHNEEYCPVMIHNPLTRPVVDLLNLRGLEVRILISSFRFRETLPRPYSAGHSPLSTRPHTKVESYSEVILQKDDSGSHAVLTEQRSSASQMTAAKFMDIISRLPSCAGQTADAISACTQVIMEDAHKLLKKKNSISECPNIWIRLPKIRTSNCTLG